MKNEEDLHNNTLKENRIEDVIIKVLSLSQEIIEEFGTYTALRTGIDIRLAKLFAKYAIHRPKSFEDFLNNEKYLKDLTAKQIYNFFYYCAFISYGTDDEKIWIVNSISELFEGIKYDTYESLLTYETDNKLTADSYVYDFYEVFQLEINESLSKEERNVPLTESQLYEELMNVSHKESFTIIGSFKISADTKNELKECILNNNEEGFTLLIIKNPEIDFKKCCKFLILKRLYKQTFDYITEYLKNGCHKKFENYLKSAYKACSDLQKEEATKIFQSLYVPKHSDYLKSLKIDWSYIYLLIIKSIDILYNVLYLGNNWNFFKNPCIKIPPHLLEKYKYYHTLIVEKHFTRPLSIEEVGIPEFEEFREKFLLTDNNNLVSKKSAEAPCIKVMKTGLLESYKEINDDEEAIDEDGFTSPYTQSKNTVTLYKEGTDDDNTDKEVEILENIDKKVESTANIDKEAFTLPDDLFENMNNIAAPYEEWLGSVKPKCCMPEKIVEVINYFAVNRLIDNDLLTKQSLAFRLTGRMKPENLIEQIPWHGTYAPLFYFIKEYTMEGTGFYTKFATFLKPDNPKENDRKLSTLPEKAAKRFKYYFYTVFPDVFDERKN